VIPDIVRRYIPAQSFSILATSRSAASLGTAARIRSYPTGDPHNASFYADGDQWNMSAIQADTAWEVSTRGSGTEVYILDSGIDTSHIEFKGGRIDLSKCITFAYAPTDTLMQNPLPFYDDVVGHGTFVSGIVSTNGDSLASVAPSARIVMVRVVDDSGSADLFGIINGILYAADEGADVINMSFGGYLARDQSIDITIADLIQRVVDYAYQSGTLLVAAAGNDALNTNDAISPTGSYADSMDYPAGMPHVLSVGATAPVNQVNDNRIASYSNFGEAGVAVFAPGGDSVAGSTDLDFLIGPCSSASNSACSTENMYYLGAGTSFASPHAAATAAVAKSQSGFSLLDASLEACELATATEVTGVRRDIDYGYGVIDVLRAATKCRNSWTFVP
jgi:subtilisin family serine protease